MEKKMPLNVRRFYSSIFLVLVAFTAVFAQSQAVNEPNVVPSAAAPVKTMTAAEVMRERISKAKAFIAVRNYNAAIYELEMLRRETSDSSVQAVTNILLMNSYLEQGNYTKAQNFLNEAFKNFKSNSANGSMFYSAVAAQVVKGARSQLERYRSLGLTVSDRNLPLEAVNDIEKMRETLELVITQTKEVSANKAQASIAMPILDEAIAARSSIGRDDYDAKRWRDEGTDIREEIASSRSTVINAIDGTRETIVPPVQQTNTTAAPQILNTQTVANVLPPQADPIGAKARIDAEAKQREQDQRIAAARAEAERQKGSRETTPEIAMARQAAVPLITKTSMSSPVNQPAAAETRNNLESGSAALVNVGSLLGYATEKVAPAYPTAAKSMRAAGIVKVEVVLDEKGEIAEVKNAAGHSLLIGAARDAIRHWKFRPVMRDGQAVRAVGYVNFNFTL
jgi:TonB family protein